MPEFSTLPDGWREVTYDVGEEIADRERTEDLDAVWASEDERIVITANRTVDDDGRVSYPVVVEQTLESDEESISTTVQSHARVEGDRKDAERSAVEFMHEVNDGMHALHLMGVEEWKDFYQFYCISDSELPGEMTGEELIESLDNEEYDADIEELDDDFDPSSGAEQTIQIDVFPRTKNEIESNDD